MSQQDRTLWILKMESDNAKAKADAMVSDHKHREAMRRINEAVQIACMANTAAMYRSMAKTL